MKETVAQINRIHYKEHEDRAELDFGYFRTVLKGKGAKRLKFKPREMKELATLFESKELMNDAIERMIEESEESKGVHIPTAEGATELPTTLPRTPFLPPVPQILTRGQKRKSNSKPKDTSVSKRTRSKTRQ